MAELTAQEPVEEKKKARIRTKRTPKQKAVKHDPNRLDDNAEASLAKKLFGFVGQADTSSDSDSDSDDVHAQNGQVAAQQSVWHDDDDDETEEIQLPRARGIVKLKRTTDQGDSVDKQEYQKRLRSAFERSNHGKAPKWAKLETGNETNSRIVDSDDDVQEALEEMTRTTGKYVEKSGILPRGIIDMSLVNGITTGYYTPAEISVLRFHKTKPVLLSAQSNGEVKIFQIDSDVKKDHFVQSVTFTKFPITCMDFLSGGTSVICGSSRQEYYMRYDLVKGTVSQSCLPKSVQAQNVGRTAISSDGTLLAMAGHTGQIHLISATSMEHIRTMAVPSEVTSLTFLPGSSDEIWIMTERGEVVVWDIKACGLHSFLDEGTVVGTKICASKDGNYIACGANTGIVNVYEPSTARIETAPKPIATVTNLTTQCDAIAFNHDSEILITASSTKVNQVKTMHMRSRTMFSNFPARYEKIDGASSLDFSPHGGYMAIGCKTGNLRCYRVGHYEGY